MVNYAKQIAQLLFLLMPVLAGAAEPSPIGQWQVENGDAHIRVFPCGHDLWGIISWLEEPDTDKNNPDPAKRDRSLLGLPILRRMQWHETRWEGEIYNADNGKKYNGNVRLIAPDTLHIEGCVLGGWICGGEDWKRISPDPATDDNAICRSLGEF